MQIQPQLRAQINSLAMARAEQTAQEEVSSYLSKKYNTAAEFSDTVLYSAGAVYGAAGRVYLCYPAYVATASYVPGSYVTEGGSAYICTGATTGTFDASKWSLLGLASSLYYAAFPAPVFNVYRAYSVGDVVFWDNHMYTCCAATTFLSGVEALQYHTESHIPLNNIFPGDALNGHLQWTDNGAYTVAANTLNSPGFDPTATYAPGARVTYTDGCVYTCITAITVAGPFVPSQWALYWVLGDNRSQLLVTHMISIALYWAHYSIAPNNIPAERHDAYLMALDWCRSVRDGDITAQVPEREPHKGQRILFDSQVKRGNSY